MDKAGGTGEVADGGGLRYLEAHLLTRCAATPVGVPAVKMNATFASSSAVSAASSSDFGVGLVLNTYSIITPFGKPEGSHLIPEAVHVAQPVGVVREQSNLDNLTNGFAGRSAPGEGCR